MFTTYKLRALLLFLIAPLQAISLSDQLQEHGQAFTNLKPHLKSIWLHTWTERWGNTITTYYNYHCPNQAVKRIFEEYRAAYGNLDLKLMEYACGEGVLIGIIAASVNKLVSKNKYDKKTAITAALAVITTLLHRFRTAPLSPYVDKYLTEHSTIFNKRRIVQDLAVSLAGACISYLTMHCAFERIAT